MVHIQLANYAIPVHSILFWWVASSKLLVGSSSKIGLFIEYFKNKDVKDSNWSFLHEKPTTNFYIFVLKPCSGQFQLLCSYTLVLHRVLKAAWAKN